MCQVFAKNGSLCANIDFSGKCIVSLNEMSNSACISAPVPLVARIVFAIFLYQVIGLDLICKVWIKTLVDLKYLVASLAKPSFCGSDRVIFS